MHYEYIVLIIELDFQIDDSICYLLFSNNFTKKNQHIQFILKRTFSGFQEKDETNYSHTYVILDRF